MATISFRVPDDVKEQMDEHGEINWSEILRRKVEEELEKLEKKDVALAVATSERLSQKIDEDVGDQNSAEIIREWRDTRYGNGNGD